MLISVVIPTCRRPEALGRCLENLEKQTLSQGEYEVIVTDDSQDEASRDLVREKFPHVRWTEGPRRGPAANRNHGASQTSGDWIVFLDDDCIPSMGWLDAIAGQTDVHIIEGKTVCPSERDTPFEERVENPAGGSYWSCNLAVRRSAFAGLGGFDEDFLEAGGEDMEFAWRIAKNKLHTRFVASAIVVHPARPVTWKHWWRRTWMMRWMVLYHLKTDKAELVRASNLKAQFEVAKMEIADLLRTTSHYFLKFDRRLWKTKLFRLVWKWLTFPLVLPYMMVWMIRFRKSIGLVLPDY